MGIQRDIRADMYGPNESKGVDYGRTVPNMYGPNESEPTTVDDAPLENLIRSVDLLHERMTRDYEQIIAEFNTRVSQRANGDTYDGAAWHVWSSDLNEFVASHRDVLFRRTLAEIQSIIADFDKPVPEGWRP